MSVVAVAMISRARPKTKVLMERRADVDHKWCFPGGKVEEGEDLAQAAAREFKEELEVDISDSMMAKVHDDVLTVGGTGAFTFTRSSASTANTRLHGQLPPQQPLLL